MDVLFGQEIDPKYLIADFEKILKKHEAFEPKFFNKDAHYKLCVSEVADILVTCIYINVHLHFIPFMSIRSHAPTQTSCFIDDLNKLRRWS